MSSSPLLRLPFDLDLSDHIAELTQKKALTLVNLGNTTAKSFVIAHILEKTSFQKIFWASNDEKADQIFSAADLFFDGKVHLIPKELSVEGFYDFREALQSDGNHLFLFEDLEKVLEQRFPKQDVIEKSTVSLKVGGKVKIFELFESLESIGYTSAEDKTLNSGEFVRLGENLFIYPRNTSECFRIELLHDEIQVIETYPQIDPDQENGPQKTAPPKSTKALDVLPAEFNEEMIGEGECVFGVAENAKNVLCISDDLDSPACGDKDFPRIMFTTFPGEKETFFHLNFFSVLPFYTVQDFVVDVKERLKRGFEVVIMTKRFDEIEKIFLENHVMFTEDLKDKTPSTTKVIKISGEEFLPHSFQNNDRNVVFLTDREIFQFHRSSRQKKAISGMNLDLMTSLKPGNFVVHTDHGLAQFDGIVRRDLEVHGGVREYLKLCYAENDLLFVPVESAEKITKFIGDEEPRLTRLGSAEWKHAQSKLKKEAERIAKDLLKLYASRECAKGKKFQPDDEMLKDFCDGFPYELTPGQLQAWNDVRADLEKPRPMDRLLCGDVGFGKTEVAMRAAFKCFRSGMQTAILTPITILGEQHFQTFQKRIKDKNYGIRVELLSRFQSPADQKRIVKDIELGLVDVVVGTHRILSDDLKFKNLGLVIIDEEQRFGVNQKEKLKKLRASVDILTMTATPIPRTLNMSLNKLKDISTITTPPPGRLPVVTEVRKYNLELIRERIMMEVDRGGQVYFLHNQVQTIESQTEQLRTLIPEAKFIIAHGQLAAPELEDRIRRFKEGEANVLVASTIIENGIDLPNANTLLVNRAEKFGLSQLYQLRGRVGRRRTQAYAYFLYAKQKLELEAKKRLRAIVEASELGSGFQIAMRDLEIRGAGEVLGVSQSGTIKTVGVSHFMRMLNKTVEEMKAGEISSDLTEEESITVEIPLSAYIPPSFIPSANEKIQTYKELASVENEGDLDELKRELRQDYGALPAEVENLCKVLKLKMLLREIHISGVKIHRSTHKSYEVVLRMGIEFSPDQIFGLIQNSQQKWVITANAIKLSLPTLPVGWYEDLLKELKMLRPKKKKNKDS